MCCTGSRECKHFLAVFAGLAIAILAASSTSYLREPVLEWSDSAVNAIQIDNARDLHEIYGNYSRFRFNHPGPAFFYVYAGSEWVLHDRLGVVPSPANAHRVAGILLQSGFLALALTILAAHFPWRALIPVGLIAAAGHFGSIAAAQGHWPFTSIWPPNVLVMPFVAFLVACASVAAGRASHLPHATIAGGFLFHGHVAQTLFVGLLGTLALASWLYGEKGRSWKTVTAAHRVPLTVSAGLAVLFLAPLIVDVVTLGSRSNAATIVAQFRNNASNPDGGKSLLQSALYFISFGTDTTNQEELLGTIGPATWQFFRENAFRLFAWMLVFIGPPIAAWRHRRRLTDPERRFLPAVYGLLLASVVACLLWGMAQAEAMAQFNGCFYYGIFFIALLLLLALAARFVERFAKPGVQVAASVVALVPFGFAFGPPKEEGNGLRILDGVRATLRADTTARPKLIVFGQESWPVAAGVALELQRSGVGFYANPWWEFMFGQRHRQNVFDSSVADQLDVWWLTTPGEGGRPVADNLALYDRPAPLDPRNGRVTFRNDGNGFRYVVSGVTPWNADHAATVLRSVLVRFEPLRTDRDVRLVINAESAVDVKGSRVEEAAEVFLNGTAVGRVSTLARADLSLVIPRDLWNGKPSATLELRFPDASIRQDRRRPIYDYQVAWHLWDLRFSND